MSTLRCESHLPNEILIIIFNHLDNDDLYRLTDVSPRFCHLSLTVYFAKSKVKISPDGQIDLRNSIKTRDMLSFLQKARFITSFNRLSCSLVHPHKNFLKDISDLTAVLRNAERVEEFVMEILASGEIWTPAMIKQVNTGNALFSALSGLFTAASCVSSSILVRHGTSLTKVLQKADQGDSRRRWFLRPITRLFSSDKLKKRTSISDVIGVIGGTSLSISSKTSSSTSVRGKLRTLDVDSIILVSPPFFEWSIQTLNSNDITSMSFGTIEFRDVQWSSLLPRIDTPALKVLVLRGHIPFGALVDFMVRHQGISALTTNSIDFRDWNGCSTSIGTKSVDPSSEEIFTKLKKAFANIIRLACCPQGLSQLISGTLHPTNPAIDLLPNLRYISVLWSLGIGQQLNMSTVNDILAPIARKLRTCKRAEFIITYRADVDSSRRPCPPRTLLQRPIGFLYRPVALTSSRTTPVNQISSNLNPDFTISTESPISLFSVFTEIKLEVTAKADPEGIPSLVKGLAKSFTAIKYFKVDTRARSGRPVQENQLMKLMLCHQILKHFQHLGVVLVDGAKCKVVEREGRGVW
jgi:hypothetical protein